MKNIHVLPTENESRIRYNSFNKVYELCEFPKYHTDIKSAHNIYITSDEEIEDGDWVYFISTNEVIKVPLGGFKGKVCKKIILTTDQYLIKDGVQAIDDEFLEWLVKNPSCEEVMLWRFHGMNTSIAEVNAISGDGSLNWQGKSDLRDYKIIIPEEEPKQETLEEIAEKYSEEFFNRDEISMRNSKVSYIAGAKCQAKQDKQEIQDLRSRLDFVHKSSAKAIELIEALQLQTEGMYNEDTIRQVLSKLTLVNPVHLQMTSNGHGEFPDGYKLTEKGIDCIVEQLKK